MRTPKSLLLIVAVSSPLGGEPDHPDHGATIPLKRERNESLRHPTPDPNAILVEAPDFREINGSGNHVADPTLGMPETVMPRLFPAAYGDGEETPAGAGRPSARAISNAVCAQSDDLPNGRGATDYLWQWGQFIDHDIDETPASDPPKPFDIPVPTGDPWFDPTGSGSVTIPLNRSYGESGVSPRSQINAITSYIDASNVYGSDEIRAYALRRLDGSGMLKTTSSEFGDLLPYNPGGFANAPSMSGDWFLAGDVRANEQAALTAMHTLFVREHNHHAGRFRASNPNLGEDDLYQMARMIVGAELQHITYHEFLPVLLGPGALPPYRGFRDQVDPSISNEFATAAFRLGHSLLPTLIRRIGSDGATIEAGDLPLASAFFDHSLIEDHGIDSLLRGLASQRCQELDGSLVDGVRNFLFGPPGSGGFDLAALNIQRGRDHGLPSYNDARRALGMRPARSFRDINPNPTIAGKLASVHATIHDVDLWVGGLCEPHVRGSMVGPVFHRILSEQFTRLRDGDRYWHESALPSELLERVQTQRLSDIIRRNTMIGDEIQNNVFLLESKPPHPKPRKHPRR